jgi:hypothetical protein
MYDAPRKKENLSLFPFPTNEVFYFINFIKRFTNNNTTTTKTTTSIY